VVVVIVVVATVYSIALCFTTGIKVER